MGYNKMKINYWKCNYQDYNEFWDDETKTETRNYNCTHPVGNGICNIDNKYGGETANCPLISQAYNQRINSFSEIEYPLRLCVEIMNFAVMSCEKTQDKKASEIKTMLLGFFHQEQIDESLKILIDQKQIEEKQCENQTPSADA